MKNYIVIVLAVFFLVSCGDREAPVVTFVTPEQNTAVSPGQEIAIQTRVTDNEQISSITVGGDVQTFNVPASDFNSLTEHTFLFNLQIGEGTPSGAEITVNVSATDLEGNAGENDLVLVVN